MNKYRCYYITGILSILFLCGLTGCKTSIDDRKITVNKYISQVGQTVFNYYQNCEFVVSPSDIENMKSSCQYNVDCIVDDGTHIMVTICYNNSGLFNNGYYSVYMERDFDSLSEAGFNEYNLKLFCELSNVASCKTLNLTTCKSFINDTEKYNIKYDDDNFTPIEKQMRTYSGHEMNYTVVDYRAGNSPYGGYCEILESAIGIK